MRRALLALGDLGGLGRGLRLGVGHLRRGSEAADGQGALALLAGTLQEAADLAVDPAEVVQQAVAELAHLLGLAEQRRPLLLDLPADVVGDLAGLLQRLLGFALDVGPGLLGLLLGLLDDRVGTAPGVLDQLLARTARLLEQRGRLPAELLERRRALPEVPGLTLQLGPRPFGLA